MLLVHKTLTNNQQSRLTFTCFMYPPSPLSHIWMATGVCHGEGGDFCLLIRIKENHKCVSVGGRVGTQVSDVIRHSFSRNIPQFKGADTADLKEATHERVCVSLVFMSQQHLVWDHNGSWFMTELPFLSDFLVLPHCHTKLTYNSINTPNGFIVLLH